MTNMHMVCDEGDTRTAGSVYVAGVEWRKHSSISNVALSLLHLHHLPRITIRLAWDAHFTVVHKTSRSLTSSCHGDK